MTDWEKMRARVEEAGGRYYYTDLQTGIDNRTKQFLIDRCEPYVRPGHAIELGYMDGVWTEMLLRKGCTVDIVEGAQSHATSARERFGGESRVRIFHSLFQEFKPDRPCDSMLMTGVIKHIPDPLEFLKVARTWLKPDGVAIAATPNNRSFHRRMGTYMGLEPAPGDLNSRDREVMNYATYDRYTWRKLLMAAGFRVDVLRGCFLKPLSSEQMKDWSDEVLRGLLAMGDELEDYSWYLYAVCSPCI